MSENIDRFLDAYNIATLQSAAQILRLAEKEGFTSDYLEDFIGRRGERNRRLVPRCPKCKRPLSFTSVNTNKANQVGEDLKLVWFCPDWLNCGYEKYSKKTIREELELSRRKENGTR